MERAFDASYRTLLKEKIRELKKDNPKFGICRIAEYLGIQQTYLSRGLNHPKAHLNEDHFYLLMEYLKLSEDEETYFRMLRDFELTQSSRRKEQLRLRIKSFKISQSLKADELKKTTLKPEEVFALDPSLMLLHVALHIEKLQKDLEALALALSLSRQDLQTQLFKLEEAGLVVLQRKLGQLRVKEIKESKVHFSREHPLMRAHQSLMREMCQSKLQSLPLKKKESFMVTFSSSKDFFEKYIEIQKKYLNEIQKLSTTETSDRVYQLNIEFFGWT